MSQYSILPQQNLVVSHGKAVTIQMSTRKNLDNIHAIQILNNTVDIEYLDGTPNKTDALVSDFQDLIDETENALLDPTVRLTVDEYKQVVLHNISLSFNTELSNGYTTKGIKMNARIFDIQQLITAQTLAIKLFNTTMNIVDYNNVIHNDIPVGVVDEIITELGQHYQTCFDKKQQLRSLVYAAKRKQDLDTIIW
ncbi:MAG: hypothetical protein EO766_12065 [Hydrotalea sp. AMD]|uniref:hypothetical protein n=1 Tax=Hydrotalea sp. AMD TaxID=2501297 RepID=UPI001027912F|nr:hypothetical protein [Hydrotalea sp. AMD]RWZ87253.1 MAG: hypothetical protein EO766_12065 [Hydrotalea sp. AMD]